MLTLKLINLKSGRTTILETARVDASSRDGGGTTLRCLRANDGIADEHQIFPGGEYDRAYVENAQGATVQMFRHDR